MPYVNIGNEPIHYVEEGQGPPLVLIHGFFAWSFTWRKNLPALAERFRTFALDLRGFGFSARGSAGPYGLDDQARLVGAFLDAQGIERATVIGHSMGGEVALRLALLQPHRVRGLVLVAPSALVRRRPGRLERLLVPVPGVGPLAVRLLIMNRRFAARALRESYYRKEVATPDAVAGYLRPASVRGSARTLAAMLRQLDFGGASDRLGEVSQPTLIVWGENDPWLPFAHAERLAALLPHARLVGFPECGHVPPEEYPERFHQVVLPFLESLPD